MKLNKWTKVLATMGLVAGFASAQDFELWKPSFGPTTAEGGYLFAYDDADNSGTSTASCGGTTLKKGDPVDPCISVEGFDVDFDVTTGVTCDWTNCNDYGFVGVGMNLKQTMGDTEAGPAEPYDVSGYKTITISYNASHVIYFQLTRDEEALAYAVHSQTLPAGDKTLTLTLEDFRQPSWATKTEEIGKILAQLTQIKFQAHTENYSNAPAKVDFLLKSLTLGGGTPGTGTPVFGVENGFNLEYNMIGENLVFNGLTDVMSVEVYDLKGKMVRSGEISSSENMISLEGLNGSSYVVRTDKGQFLLPLVD